MIRKIAHSTIAFFVLVSTMGFTLDFHYCHGNLYSVSLAGHSNTCNMDNSCGNCSDQTVKVKISDNYLVSSTASVQHQIPVITLDLPVISVPEIRPVSVPQNIQTDPSPPGPGDILLLTHSFLC